MDTLFPTGTSGTFDEFWSAYPRKRGKRDAQKAWRQTAKERPPLDDLLAKVEELSAQDDHWRRGYIPYPATWLRAGGWDDEPIKSNGARPHAWHPNPAEDF